MSPASQLRWKSVYWVPAYRFFFHAGSGTLPGSSPGRSMPVSLPRLKRRASSISG